MKKLLISILSLIIILLLVVTFYCYNNYKNYLKYSTFINNSAVEYNIDSLLIVSIIKAESDFNPEAVSKKGAIGLMQIMPATARDMVNNNLKYETFKTSDLYNPQINIDLGTEYLQFLLKSFNNDVNLALSAYNAGIGNVLKWNQDSKIYDEDKVLFKETKKYVKKVNKTYKLLKKIKKYSGKK